MSSPRYAQQGGAVVCYQYMYLDVYFMYLVSKYYVLHKFQIHMYLNMPGRCPDSQTALFFGVFFYSLVHIGYTKLGPRGTWRTPRSVAHRHYGASTAPREASDHASIHVS